MKMYFHYTVLFLLHWKLKNFRKLIFNKFTFPKGFQIPTTHPEINLEHSEIRIYPELFHPYNVTINNNDNNSNCLASKLVTCLQCTNKKYLLIMVDQYKMTSFLLLEYRTYIFPWFPNLYSKHSF